VRATKSLAAAVVMVGTLGLWVGAASAHVTIEPDSAQQGAGDQVLTFRVPNEDEKANTIQLDVQFPVDHPIAVVDPLTIPGWTVTTKTTHLDTPIKTDDGTFTDVVSEVSWAGGKIPPHQYGEFKVLAQGLPTGVTSLTFKSIQTYDNNTQVAWVETGDNAEHPAPVLTLTPAPSDTGSTTTVAGSGGAVPPATTVGGESTTTVPVASTAASSVAPTTLAPTAVASSGSSDSSKGLAIAALVVGGLGLIAGAAAFVVARRRPAAASTPVPPTAPLEG